MFYLFILRALITLPIWLPISLICAGLRKVGAQKTANTLDNIASRIAGFDKFSW